MNDYTAYTITKAPDTGSQIVRYHGVRIGSSQTLAAARIIRRNHMRKIENEDRILGERETQSDRDAWYDMDR